MHAFQDQIVQAFSTIAGEMSFFGPGARVCPCIFVQIENMNLC